MGIVSAGLHRCPFRCQPGSAAQVRKGRGLMSAADPALPGSSAHERPDRDEWPVDWYELFFDLVFVAVIAISSQASRKVPGCGW
jgi:hypothetical protein